VGRDLSSNESRQNTESTEGDGDAKCQTDEKKKRKKRKKKKKKGKKKRRKEERRKKKKEEKGKRKRGLYGYTFKLRDVSGSDAGWLVLTPARRKAGKDETN